MRSGREVFLCPSKLKELIRWSFQEERVNRSRMIFYGNSEVTIENYHELICLTKEQIVINLPEGIMEIRGRDLAISTIYEEEMVVVGMIDQIFWKPIAIV